MAAPDHAGVIASILIVARSGAAALQAQLECLAAADLDGVEVVIVCDAPDTDVADLVRRLEGDVVVRWREAPKGRRAALPEAASAASGEVCIALGPTARPVPGFAAPLAAAVLAGAVLAAPVIDAWGEDAHGYTEGADGALLPRAHGSAAPLDALALDCLAVRRGHVEHLLGRFDTRAGFHEVQLTRLAQRVGRVEVVEDSVVQRGCVGPPASVLVATRNRVEEIAPCVEALVAHGVLRAGGEVVVVDNGSTDGTDEVVAELVARHGDGVRLVREPVAGASRARNTGAEACRHEVVLLSDDDARPAPGWYEALRDAFADPGVAMGGGAIRAIWPDDPDLALLDSPFLGYFSILDRGDHDHDVPVPHCVYGANWAIRKSALQAVGGFPEELGVSAGCKINGEEVAVEFSVARFGIGRSRYVAAAANGHRVSEGRISEDYLQMRSFRAGAEYPQLLRFLLLDELPSRLVPHADAAGWVLASRVVLEGAQVDVDAAFATVVRARVPLQARMAATFALGEITACATLLGRDRWTLPDGVELVVRPEHALGHLRPPATVAA